jgi:TrmH RNA methyltransferase
MPPSHPTRPANPPGPGPSPRPGELKLCGLSAVRARFRRDAGSIRRLYFDYETGRKIGVICKVLAAGKKIYRCVEPAELEKVAGTIHHGGIVAVVAEVKPSRVGADEPAAWARKREPLLVLDRIGNAHNLGAIARTAAFFGVPRIVIPEGPGAAQPNDAAYRVSEGGLEFIEVRVVPLLPEFLRELAAAGYDVLGTSPHGEKPGRVPENGGTGRPPGRPAAIVLGNEEHGLSPAAQAACTRLVTIRGSGQVESLNVSATAAVLIWALARGTAAAL